MPATGLELGGDLVPLLYGMDESAAEARSEREAEGQRPLVSPSLVMRGAGTEKRE